MESRISIPKRLCYLLLIKSVIMMWQVGEVSACLDDPQTNCTDAVITNKCLTSKSTVQKCKRTCLSNVKCGGTINDTLAMCRLFNDSEVCGTFESLCGDTCALKKTVFCDVNVFPNSYFKTEMGFIINDTVATYGTSVMINCNPGFYDSLPVRMACDMNGSWVLETDLGTSLDCKRSKCDTPEGLASNNTHPNTTEEIFFGDSVDFYCDLGYTQTGGSNGRHECSISDKKLVWTPDPLLGEMPICRRVRCPQPPFIAGAISQPQRTDVFYNESVTYQCQTPHIHADGGDGRRTCNSDGVWEKDSAVDTDPKCLRSCQEPPSISNGTHNSSFPYFAGTVVEYVCDTGYENTGGGDGRMVCQDGVFDWRIVGTRSDFPVCTGKICDTLPTIYGAQASVSEVPLRYPISINLVCTYGYNQTGGSLGRKHCNEQGSWIPDPTLGEPPVCTRINCSLPPSTMPVPNAHTNQSEPFFAGDVIIYVCNSGYRPSGNGTGLRSCNVLGEWNSSYESANFPNCTRIAILIDMPIYKKFVPNVVEAAGSWIFGLVGYLCILFVIVFLLLMDAPLYYRHIRYMFLRNIRHFIRCTKPETTESGNNYGKDEATTSSAV